MIEKSHVNASGVENHFNTRREFIRKVFDSAQPDNWELDEKYDVNSSRVENLFTTKHKCRNKGFDSTQPDNWELNEKYDVNSSGVENLVYMERDLTKVLRLRSA